MSEALQQKDGEVREGDILAGKYRVEQVLGQGGMGVVVAATHTVLQNRVALKFLLPSVAKHHQTAARFLREAQSAVKIKSPHVARVIDVGQMDDTGSPYMVMEYLEGKDMGALLESEGPLDVAQACMFMLQTCEALAAAHAAGIVHRDIKPANLFITPGPDGQPMVKVLDFGISKNVLDMGISKLTQTQTSMGSPLYMSPEQMRSARDVDARTDLWSLGVVLFEMLTGQTPYVADTMPQLVALVLEEEAPSINVFRQGVPPEVVAAVARCLKKDRTQRYQHVGQFAEAIAPFVPRVGALSAERTSRIISTAGLDRTVEVVPAGTGQELDIGAVPPPKLSGTVTAFGRTGSGTTSSASPARPFPLGLVLGGAGLLVGLGALGIVLLSGPGENNAVTAAAASSAANQVAAPVATVLETAEAAAVEAASAQPAEDKAPLPSAASTPTPEPPVTEAAPNETAPTPAKRTKSGPKKTKGSDPFGDRF